jgi:hypothetical protein
MIERKIGVYHLVDMQLNGLNTPGFIAKTSPVMMAERENSVDREKEKIFAPFSAATRFEKTTIVNRSSSR